MLPRAVVRPAAVDLIQHLAWELPYATGAALKSRKKGKKKKITEVSFPLLSFQLVVLLWFCAFTVGLYLSSLLQ